MKPDRESPHPSSSIQRVGLRTQPSRPTGGPSIPNSVPRLETEWEVTESQISLSGSPGPDHCIKSVPGKVRAPGHVDVLQSGRILSVEPVVSQVSPKQFYDSEDGPRPPTLCTPTYPRPDFLPPTVRNPETWGRGRFGRDRRDVSSATRHRS